MDHPFDLFLPGRYRAVRIPAIAVVGQRTLVAMAVGRRRLTDFGPSDLLIRRSMDGGQSWGRTRVLVRGWWRTVDNPTLVVDPVGGALHVFFQTDYRRLWQRTSIDGGRTFRPRVDLSRVVRAASTPDFRVDRIAPGPGAAAVLSGGRLVVPVWANQGRGQRPSVVLTIVSDDHGRSWQPGEIIAGPGGEFPNPTEASVAPTADGGAVLSFRQATVPHRVFTWSPDGATRWTAPRAVPELYEPVCQAPPSGASSPASKPRAPCTSRARFAASFINCAPTSFVMEPSAPTSAPARARAINERPSAPRPSSRICSPASRS